MTPYELTREIEIECPLDELFPFFADAGNLEAITPPWLRFRILSRLPIEMKEGALIRYRLRLRGIPISWTSRISTWDPPTRFVDEQLSGPFRSWIHEHSFEDRGHRTIARDRVLYEVPGGAFIHRTLVRPELDRIFAYREHVLRKFGASRRAPDAPARRRSTMSELIDDC